MLATLKTKFAGISKIVMCSSEKRWNDEIAEVIELYEVNDDVKFAFALPYWKQVSAKKIAEGSYGEIYSFRHSDGSLRVFKCLPVNGRHPSKDSPNMPLKIAISDIVCSKSLNKLNDGSEYVAPNFPLLYSACIVKDKFPVALLKSWLYFKYKESSRHPQPDLYKENQRFVTIETSFCGFPLTKEFVKKPLVGVSIMTQLVSALAVAEEAYKFEHRDLHLGNVLIRQTQAIKLKYVLRDLSFTVKTAGIQMFIIDFTFSRISDDSRVYCAAIDHCSRPLVTAESMWLQQDTIYDIMMKILEDRWTAHIPKTNIFWLKYINESILDFLEKNDPTLLRLVPGPCEFNEMRAIRLLLKWNDCLLDFDSARQLLEAVILQNNPLVDVKPSGVGDVIS